MNSGRRAQSWDDCDGDVKQYIQSIVKMVSDFFGNDLVGVYLHGSLAMGSYYRPKSDIDLIIVVESVLNPNLRKSIANSLVRLSKVRPTLGNLEVSVITQEVAKFFSHPCPFEVHYSSDWHEKIINDQVDFSQNNEDPDLAAHITYVVKRGIVLKGKKINEVFGSVPWRYFLASILDDFGWIVENENILESPFYSVLNICRVIRTLTERDENVFSKDEGGEWALVSLPKRYHPLIQKALDVYRSERVVTSEERRTGGVPWKREELLEFRDLARERAATLKQA